MRPTVAIRAGIAVLLASVGISACCFTPAGEPDGGDGYSRDAGATWACRIEGGEQQLDAPNPLNECQSCQPAISRTSWTNLPEGSPCSVKEFCSDGACVQGCLIDGVVLRSGALNLPGNIAGCQQCLPAMSLVSWSNAEDGTHCLAAGSPGVCDVGNCYPGCFIDGAVYSPDEINRQNLCQSCQPSVSSLYWSNPPRAPPAGGPTFSISATGTGPASIDCGALDPSAKALSNGGCVAAGLAWALGQCSRLPGASTRSLSSVLP
jgi:hypothetical protein